MGAVGIPEAERDFSVEGMARGVLHGWERIAPAGESSGWELCYRGRTGMQEPSGDHPHPAAGARGGDPGEQGQSRGTAGTPGASHRSDAQTPGMTTVNAARVWEGIKPPELGGLNQLLLESG